MGTHIYILCIGETTLGEPENDTRMNGREILKTMRYFNGR